MRGSKMERKFVDGRFNLPVRFCSLFPLAHGFCSRFFHIKMLRLAGKCQKAMTPEAYGGLLTPLLRLLETECRHSPFLPKALDSDDDKMERLVESAMADAPRQQGPSMLDSLLGGLPTK